METGKEDKIEECIAALRAGTLTEQALRTAFATTSAGSGHGGKRQDLLYLQCSSVGVDSTILGMRMVVDGEFDDGPDDPHDWPYKSVIAAIIDGWRIVNFPDLGMLMDESKTFGLGHEFILEKWH